MNGVKSVFLGILAFVLATVLIMGLMVWATGMEVFGLRLGKHVENARTGVTRSTNQYVTTQQHLLLQYAKEYTAAEEAGNTAQMASIKGQMENIAATLDPQYIPPSAAAIVGIQ